jgi:AcrR family transcriptional regulator
VVPICNGSAGGLREGKKRETRRRIREQAMRLFLANGFEATTVEEIAAAAGISYMTFFRYFRAKHDVIGDESSDRALLHAIEQRPSDETPFDAVHHAALAALEAEPAPEGLADLARLILSSPALRSWLWERHRRRERGIADALVARDPQLDGSVASVIAAACVAVMGAAVAEWVADPQSADLRGHLDKAFRAMRGSIA